MILINYLTKMDVDFNLKLFYVEALNNIFQN